MYQGGSTCLRNIPKKNILFSASLVSGYEKTLFLIIESVSQTFWVVSKCVDYVENTYVLKILTCELFCWIIRNDSRPFSVLYIVTHFKCSFFYEYKCGYEVES